MLPGFAQFFENLGAPTPPLPYDAEVNYLESTGTQWIDTGFYGTANMIFSCRFVAVGSTLPNYPAFYGVNGRNLLGGYFRSVSGGSRLTAGSLSNIVNIAIDLNEWHELVVSTKDYDRYILIDGVELQSSSTVTTLTTVNTVRLFAGSATTVSPPSTFGFGRISNFSIASTSNGESILDLIPVRFTNEQGVSEGAMYDRLGVGGMNPDGSPRTDGLYRNRGTGALILGPDKS